MQRYALVFWRLLGLVRPLLLFLVLAILTGALGFLAAIAVPLLGGGALAAFLAHKDALAVLLPWLPICALLRGALRYVEQLCNHTVAFRILAHVRDLVFGALRRLAPAKLQGHNKGDLVALVTADVELLEVFFAHTVSPIAIAVLVCAAMLVYFAQLHVWLALLAAAGYLVLGCLLPLWVARRTAAAGQAHRAAFAQLNSLVLQTLRGLRELLQFSAGTRQLAALDASDAALATAAKPLQRTDAITNALAGLCVAGGGAVLLLASATLGLPRAQLFLAPLAWLSSCGPVLALAGVANHLAHTFAAGERVLALLDEPPETPDVTNGIDIAFAGMRCEQVGFRYAGSQAPVLNQLDFEVPSGHIVGVQGKSGCGKSTLLRLLMRFWDPQSGQICIANQNIKSLNTHGLRAMQSLVEQETQLFFGSIAENLRLVKPNATNEELHAACRAAACHNFIMQLPKGYETALGVLGEGLSGGERQRIGLARAFLHGAPLLLLDEPTSNLDRENEQLILEAIAATKGTKTVVLVSHRDSTMAVADTLLALQASS